MRVSHIGVCVRDPVRAQRFYEQALGFRHDSDLRVAGEPSDTLLRLRGVDLRAIYLERDGVRIELLHYAAPGTVGDGKPREMNRLGFTHLSLDVEDLDGAQAEVARAGGQVLAETRIEIPAAGVRAVFVSDPDGTLIELVQRPSA